MGSAATLEPSFSCPRCGIPGLHDPHRRLHDGHTDLDEPAGNQQCLAERVPAVSVDLARIFAIEIQRLANATVAEQGERSILLIGEGVAGRWRGPLKEEMTAAMEPAWMTAVLESRDRMQAGRTAPPEGLFLVGVSY